MADDYVNLVNQMLLLRILLNTIYSRIHRNPESKQKENKSK